MAAVAETLAEAHKARNFFDEGEQRVQALIELIAGLVALLAAATLSHFGVEMQAPGQNREVHRVSDCGGPKTQPAVIATSAKRSC